MEKKTQAEQVVSKDVFGVNSKNTKFSWNFHLISKINLVIVQKITRKDGRVAKGGGVWPSGSTPDWDSRTQGSSSSYASGLMAGVGQINSLSLCLSFPQL